MNIQAGMRRQNTTVNLVLAALLFHVAGVVACCGGRQVSSADLQAAPEPSPPVGKVHFPVPDESVPAKVTQVEMRNVNFRADDAVILHIRRARGEMFDKNRGEPLNFDDKRSFIFKIAQAEIGVDGRTLSALMNQYVFGYRGAPLTNLVITVEGDQLRQEGVMHKGIAIPFTMLADVSLTADGWIRVHPTKIEICNLNGAALMKALGMSLEKLLDLSKAKGVRVEKNDLLLDPIGVLPPPTIQGRLAAIRLEGDEMVQVWDSGQPLSPLTAPFPNEPNYMYYRDGTLRMGKLFMVEADMQVVDTDPSDPFDFFLDYYNSQLAAGYTENLSDYGLEVFMRDFGDLDKPAQTGEKLRTATSPAPAL